MSHIVAEKRVNQFLPSEKLSVPDGELHTNYNGQELENTIWDIAVAKLYQFDIDSWLSATDKPIPSEIPNLVLDIIAMWVAGAIYNKQFAEESEDTSDSYGSQLKDDALALLQGIVEHSLVIEGLIESDVGTKDQPSFLVTDPIFSIESEF